MIMQNYNMIFFPCGKENLSRFVGVCRSELPQSGLMRSARAPLRRSKAKQRTNGAHHAMLAPAPAAPAPEQHHAIVIVREVSEQARPQHSAGVKW